MSFKIARDYRKLTEQVMADERYQKNIEFEYRRPQSGRPARRLADRGCAPS